MTAALFQKIGSWNDSNGEYTVHIAHGEPYDDFADNNSTSGVIEVGSSVNGFIGENGADSDWFQVSIENAGSYQFYFEGPGNSSLTMRDDSGNHVAGGSGNQTLIDIGITNAGTGIYYLEVHSSVNSGDYTLYALNTSPVDDFFRYFTTGSTLNETTSGIIHEHGDADYCY